MKICILLDVVLKRRIKLKVVLNFESEGSQVSCRILRKNVFVADYRSNDFVLEVCHASWREIEFEM